MGSDIQLVISQMLLYGWHKTSITFFFVSTHETHRETFTCNTLQHRILEAATDLR